MLIIDPIQNLFLGSAEYFMKSLILGRGLISESDIQVIQKRMDNFTVPADIGRIPHKIATGFSSFTADQWKNWVCQCMTYWIVTHLSAGYILYKVVEC